MLTIEEVAEQANVSQRTAKTWAQKGILRPIRITPRCTRYDPDQLDQVLGRGNEQTS